MQEEIRWNDRMSIGVEEVDKAHRRLFSIVRKLQVSVSEDAESRERICMEGIKYFKSYAVKHFAEEEEYMQSVGYEGYEVHRQLHENFRDKTLPALERDLELSNYSLEASQHFLGLMVSWLNGHIMVEDRAITGKVANKWTHTPNKEEMASLEKAIIRVAQEAFRLAMWIVSDRYAGEEFGKAVCYRMSCVSLDGERMKIYLVFEEKLALHIVSEALYTRFSKVDKIVGNTIKRLSLHTLRRIEVFCDLVRVETIVKENILTDEQLRKDFELGYPHYGLLFDSRNGYFGFCIKKDRMCGSRTGSST